MTAEATADGLLAQLGNDPTVTDIEPVRQVDLPAGTAYLLRCSQADEPNSSYLLAADDALLLMACTTREARPEDDWLSIAETIGFLPEPASGSDSPSPLLAGGHVERRADGFAVVFPEEWDVTDLPAAFSDEQPEVVDEHGSRGRVRTLLLADDPDSDTGCALIDFTDVAKASPPWTSVDDAVSSRRTALAEEPDAGAPATTFIDLPAGRAGRLDVTLGGQDTSRYYISDGAAWFSLSCASSEPPDDRWLSIAETFSFLPVEPSGVVAQSPSPPSVPSQSPTATPL
jgi:hypothetical protein